MIETTTCKNSYTANGTQRNWPITFPYEAPTELEFYIWSGSELNQISSTDYTLNEDDGYITYPKSDSDPAVTSGYVVVILRNTPQTQLEDSDETSFKSDDIERMADKLTVIAQELQEQLGRCIMFNVGEAGELDAGKYIRHLKSLVIEATTQATTATTQAGIATTKAGEAANSASAASTSATKASKWAEGNDSEVQELGGTHSAKNWAGVAQTYAESPAVQTVATNISNVNTVASNITNVNAVGNISPSVSTVAGISSSVTQVAEDSSVVNTVATNIESVNSVYSNLTTIAAVNNNKTNINTVATNKNSINAVSANIANVNAVAANETNINAVNANKTNIDAVVGNATNINAVAGNATNINAVNSNKTNINKVANKISDVTTVATNVSDVSSVATNITKVNSVATNMNKVTAVADDLTNIDTAVANLPDLQDKQNKTLDTALTIGGTSRTTVEAALGALVALPQTEFTVINGGDSTNA